MAQKELKGWMDQEEVTKRSLFFRTEFLEVKVTDGTISRMRDTITKMTKKGKAKFTDKEQHQKMVELVIKKAKVRKNAIQKITGEDWELSIRRIFEDMFQLPYRKDEDKPKGKGQIPMPKAETAPVNNEEVSPQVNSVTT